MRRFVPLLLATLLVPACQEDEGTGFVVHVEPGSANFGTVPQLQLKVFVDGQSVLDETHSRANQDLGIQDGRYASFAIEVTKNLQATRRIWVRSAEPNGNFDSEAASVQGPLTKGETRVVTLKLSKTPLRDDDKDGIPNRVECPRVDEQDTCLAALPPGDGGAGDGGVDAN